MVRYGIDDVTEGMVLGESIFTSDGKLLIAGGFEIKQVHIDSLRQKGIKSVMINVEGTEDVVPESIISQHVKAELAVTIERSKKDITSLFEQRRATSERIGDIITKEKKVLNSLISSSNMFAVIKKVIDDILTEPWTMLNISKMREKEEGLFDYVVSVTVISLCIGHKYRFSPDEMRQLGIGALNYDIGMIAIPRHILAGETPLTDSERKMFQQHSIYGHLMLSDNLSIPPTSSIVALAHHENQDGTGYPRGLKGDNKPPIKNIVREGGIHRFAEIVAVADAYDMFVHGRKHFSPKLGPAEAIKSMLALRGTRLNSDIVKTLIAMAPAYPVGTRIRITNGPIPDLIGCTGVVAKADPEHLYDPQVLVYESKAHTRIKPIVLDLTKHKGFTIELVD
jgi:HD-GYP domain-containing protein (c-di-GMP phosphodiesterase class II)